MFCRKNLAVGAPAGLGVASSPREIHFLDFWSVLFLDSQQNIISTPCTQHFPAGNEKAEIF